MDPVSWWRQFRDGWAEYPFVRGRQPNLTECTLRWDSLGKCPVGVARVRSVRLGWEVAGSGVANFPLCSLNQNCNKIKVVRTPHTSLCVSSDMNTILVMEKLFHQRRIYLSHILSFAPCGSCNLFNYFNLIFSSVCRLCAVFAVGCVG